MEKGNYALVFRGHSFGYEVQATAKLFIPGVRVILCEDGVIPEEIPNILLTHGHYDHVAGVETIRQA
ncbi:MAG: MBL fold metallo-hydrolase, partial [Oscillospiraceae bacterium]|nr:MBL fold metallo-hydrolase [Oscillospiraceae bacterium]